jgi:hypothetical protein
MKAALLLALAACAEHGSPVSTGTQSLRVDLVSPANPGDIDHRLPGSPPPTVVVNVTALGPDGNLDPTFDSKVFAYAQFLGTLTPALDSGSSLASFTMSGGKAMNQSIPLPPVFGQTVVWIDDGADSNPTYASGTSPILWFTDPFIKDVQQPKCDANPPTSNCGGTLDALTAAPLDGKNVAVNSSRYGARGRLVLTSVFAQGYTVADVQCADSAGHPPCVAGPYDFVEVFTFSAPTDQNGGFVAEGEVIDGFSGGMSEFNGLTEVGFPQTFVTDPSNKNPSYEPPPVKIDPATWFLSLSDPSGGVINFERNEAGPVEIDNVAVCNLDSDYSTFKQWKLDPSGVGGDCSNNHNVINVITAGVIAQLDPATLVGKKLPKVVGILRPVNANGNFNVWIIYPRSMADITQ